MHLQRRIKITVHSSHRTSTFGAKDKSQNIPKSARRTSREAPTARNHNSGAKYETNGALATTRGASGGTPHTAHRTQHDIKVSRTPNPTK